MLALSLWLSPVVLDGFMVRPKNLFEVWYGMVWYHTVEPKVEVLFPSHQANIIVCTGHFCRVSDLHNLSRHWSWRHFRESFFLLLRSDDDDWCEESNAFTHKKKKKTVNATRSSSKALPIPRLRSFIICSHITFIERNHHGCWYLGHWTNLILVHRVRGRSNETKEDCNNEYMFIWFDPNVLAFRFEISHANDIFFTLLGISFFRLNPAPLLIVWSIFGWISWLLDEGQGKVNGMLLSQKQNDTQHNISL